MEDEPINQNYLIGCDTIENLPSTLLSCVCILRILDYFPCLTSSWYKICDSLPLQRIHSTALVVDRIIEDTAALSGGYFETQV